MAQEPYRPDIGAAYEGQSPGPTATAHVAGICRKDLVDLRGCVARGQSSLALLSLSACVQALPAQSQALLSNAYGSARGDRRCCTKLGKTLVRNAIRRPQSTAIAASRCW
jgi:hypothetical protein